MTCQTRNTRTQRKLPSVILFQRFCYGLKWNQFFCISSNCESKERKEKKNYRVFRSKWKFSYCFCAQKSATMSIVETITSCFWFNPEYQRNTLSSMLAGILVNRNSLQKKDKNESFSFIVLESANLHFNCGFKKKLLVIRNYCFCFNPNCLFDAKNVTFSVFFVVL